jgi:hypothetical protein
MYKITMADIKQSYVRSVYNYCYRALAQEKSGFHSLDFKRKLTIVYVSVRLSCLCGCV